VDELINVRVVLKLDVHNLVVEYTDNSGQLKRTIVPATMVHDNQASTKDLMSGLPYGEAWEHMIMLRRVTPLMYATALRKRGIWTKEDLLAHPAEVMSAIQEVHGVELSHLLTMVRR
jgi:hypothetical protein